MKISVNCPSYKRAKDIKTIDYLSFVNVWVDEAEAEEYKKYNPGAIIKTIPSNINGNIARVRNYILDSEFNNGIDAVCFVDDDLKGIYRYEVEDGFGYKEVKVEEYEFMDFLNKYSLLCKEFGFKMWGVNLNYDRLSFRYSVPFSTTSVVLGPFSVQFKSDIRYDENIPLKEDYDLAISHINKYRGILRVNAYHYICNQSNMAGGCSNYRNREIEEKQFNYLQKKWGNKIVKRDKSKKTKDKVKAYNDYNPIIKIPIKGI